MYYSNLRNGVPYNTSRGETRARSDQAGAGSLQQQDGGGGPSEVRRPDDSRLHRRERSAGDIPLRAPSCVRGSLMAAARAEELAVAMEEGRTALFRLSRRFGASELHPDAIVGMGRSRRFATLRKHLRPIRETRLGTRDRRDLNAARRFMRLAAVVEESPSFKSPPPPTRRRAQGKLAIVRA